MKMRGESAGPSENEAVYAFANCRRRRIKDRGVFFSNFTVLGFLDVTRREGRRQILHARIFRLFISFANSSSILKF